MFLLLVVCFVCLKSNIAENLQDINQYTWSRNSSHLLWTCYHKKKKKNCALALVTLFFCWKCSVESFCLVVL